MADGEYASDQQSASGPGEGSAPITAVEGKKWVKQQAREETQWAVIGLCGFSCPPFYQRDNFFSKCRLKIRSTFGSRIHEESHRWQRDICSTSAANSCRRAHAHDSCNVFGLGADSVGIGLVSEWTWLTRVEQVGPMCRSFFPAGVLVAPSGC